MWSVIGGVPPTGLTLFAGVLQGSLAETGTFGFLVEVRDIAGATIRRAFAISVHQAGETVANVVNGASFQPGASPGSWITIQGSALSSSTRRARPAEVFNGLLPTQLDDVGVTVDGQRAFLSYISPEQINALLPNSVSLGTVPLQIVNNLIPGPVIGVTITPLSPSFFTWPGNYASATHADLSPAAKARVFEGFPTLPARPGELIILWGNGFGPVSPPVPSGFLTPADVPHTINTPLLVKIGGAAAEFVGGKLSPGEAGVYQIAVRVPASAPNGDWPVVVEMGGVSSPPGVLLTIQR